MTEENKPESVEGTSEPEPARPEWQYKTQLKLHSRTRELIEETIKATKVEIERQRKKLSKLTYGV